MNQPQDHKPKTGTVAGINITIDPSNLNDWDIVEGVALMQDAEATDADKLVASVRVMRRLFGADYERVKKELRAKHDGSLTADVMGEFLTEAFKALNPNS